MSISIIYCIKKRLLNVYYLLFVLIRLMSFELNLRKISSPEIHDHVYHHDGEPRARAQRTSDHLTPYL